MTVPNAAVRLDTYNRFVRHNRLIAVLRWAVPVAGIIALAIPVAQFLMRNVADIIPVEGIRLENDTLVVDGPRFEGRTATGSNYSMVAAHAETRVGNLDTIDLFDLDVDLNDDGGYWAEVEFSSAEWTMSTEYLRSNEDVLVSDSTGASGTLAGVDVDWPAQTILSEGPIVFTFETGARLAADTMVYDLEAARWNFSRVDLQMLPQPDAGDSRDPFAEEN